MADGREPGATGGTGMVGYGRPPVSGRFTKGRSGNPKGRPKGVGKTGDPAAQPKSLNETVRTEAAREIIVTDQDGKVRSVPVSEVIVKKLAVNAAKGSHPSSRTFTQLLAAAERELAAHQALPATSIEAGLQLMQAVWLLENTPGLAFPAMLPRSDEVEIDFATGIVTLRRPMSRAEQALWEGCWMMKARFRAERDLFARHRADPAFAGFRIALAERMSILDRTGQVIDRVLVDTWHLTPAELVAPPRHVRPDMTWEFLRGALSPPALRLLDGADAALLSQQLLRRSYEVVVGFAGLKDDPTPQALRARLLAHPGVSAKTRGALSLGGEGGRQAMPFAQLTP